MRRLFSSNGEGPLFCHPNLHLKSSSASTYSVARITPSPPFLRNPAASSSSTRRRRGDALPSPANQLWVDTHCPQHVEALAVHKKKVIEFTKWVEAAVTNLRAGVHCPKLLVLTGPAGCGKSALVAAVSRSLRLDLCEWSSSAGSHWHDEQPQPLYSQGPRYESKLAQFQQFLLRSHKYRLSFDTTGPSKGRLVLVEEFPVLHSREAADAFHAIIRDFLATACSPAVFIVNSEGTQNVAESSSASHSVWGPKSYGGVAGLLSKDLQFSPYVTTLTLNPVAPTAVSKVLTTVALAEGFTLPPDVIQNLAEGSGGDLRNAINSLQFYCTAPDALTAVIPKPPPTKRKRPAKPSTSACKPPKAKQPSAASLSLCAVDEDALDVRVHGCRDVLFSIFHVLGKVLYGKRDAPAATLKAESSAAGGALRGALQFVPEKVLERSQEDAARLLAFLHHNFPPFFEDMDDLALASHDLSTADLFSTPKFVGQDRLNLSPYIFSIASRGILFHNQHPAPRTWQPLMAPQMYAVASRCRENLSAGDALFRPPPGPIDPVLSHVVRGRVALWTEIVPAISLFPPFLHSTKLAQLLPHYSPLSSRRTASWAAISSDTLHDDDNDALSPSQDPSNEDKCDSITPPPNHGVPTNINAAPAVLTNGSAKASYAFYDVPGSSAVLDLLPGLPRPHPVAVVAHELEDDIED